MFHIILYYKGAISFLYQPLYVVISKFMIKLSCSCCNSLDTLSPYLLFLTKCIPDQFCVFYILCLLPNLPISDFLSASRITLYFISFHEQNPILNILCTTKYLAYPTAALFAMVLGLHRTFLQNLSSQVHL